MKRILVNDRCLYRPNAGVAMYLRNVLSHWPADAAVQPAGFMSDHLGRQPQSAGESQGATPLQLRPLAKLGRPASLGARLPHWARRGLQKLYASAYAGAARRGYAGQFEPNHLAVPTGVPTAATIHDLSVLDHGEWHPDDRVQWWRADLERAVAATDRWIAVSQFTRRRMIDALSLPPERIEVIPLAARELPPPDPDRAAQAAREAGLPGRFLLHLGTLEPRKNLATLLDAWSLLPADFRREVRLVLAGGVGWGPGAFWSELVHHPAAGEVMVCGYVSDADAALLLSAALAVVVPSRYEGFGLPVLEAMNAGTPVLCSTAEALVELSAGAAEVISPDDPDAWAPAIRRAAEDADWRERLSAAGRARAAEFSWAETARRHAELLAKLVEA